jgi:hypothetical protein
MENGVFGNFGRNAPCRLDKGKFRDMTNSNVYVLFATHDEHAVYTRKVDDVASSVAGLRTLHAAHRRR